MKENAEDTEIEDKLQNITAQCFHCFGLFH